MFVLISLVGPSEAQTPTPAPAGNDAVSQMSAGPCNMITLNVSAKDMMGSTFDGFSVQPTAYIGSLTVRNLRAYFTIRLKTGTLTCTTSRSQSRISGRPTRPSAKWKTSRANAARITIGCGPRGNRLVCHVRR
jgi:hypothetical protein